MNDQVENVIAVDLNAVTMVLLNYVNRRGSIVPTRTYMFIDARYNQAVVA